MPRPLRAILFDFSDTLFRTLDTPDWIAAAAARIGRRLAERDAALVAEELDRLFAAAARAASQAGRDLSQEAHREATMSVLASASTLEAELAEALYEGIGAPGFWQPYADAEPTLRALRDAGLRTGVVSNIPWDVRDRFREAGLADLVDAFALSFEVGVEKPDPRIFQAALSALGVEPGEALMVGDNPLADGGATGAGIDVLLLPRVPLDADRGLARVLDLVAPRLDHVQVAAPPGCEEEARRFYGALVGLAEVEKPQPLAARGGVWFRLGAQQLHVGVEDDFAPARKAHPALRVPDLDALAARLGAAGVEPRWDDELHGVRRFYASDPWGNRLEFLEPSPPPVRGS